MRRLLLPIVLVCQCLPLAQTAPKTPAAMGRIKEADLKRDMYALAGDAMRGR